MNRLLHDNFNNSNCRQTTSAATVVFVNYTGSEVGRMVWQDGKNIPETDSLAMSGKYGSV